MGLLDNIIDSFVSDEKPDFFETIGFYIKHGDDKGLFGEYLTQYMLNCKRLPGYRKILCNLYLPYKNATTETDVIMIHENGIYVIESKNYSGWIFGNEKQTKWTQMLNKNNKSYFFNPVLQNRTHIRALSEYTKIRPSFIKSYIVFSERCELKKVPENTSEYVITKRNDLIDLLIKDIKGEEIRFSSSQIDNIYNYLLPLTNVSSETKRKHVENINKNYKQ